MKKSLLLSFTCGLIVLLAACKPEPNSETTRGRIGSFNYSQLLPQEVIEKGSLPIRTYQVGVRLGKPPADVKLTWRAAEDGGKTYLYDGYADVLKPVEGVSLHFSAADEPDGCTNNRELEQTRVQVTWDTEWSNRGGHTAHAEVIALRSDGTASIDKTMIPGERDSEAFKGVVRELFAIREANSKPSIETITIPAERTAVPHPTGDNHGSRSEEIPLSEQVR